MKLRLIIASISISCIGINTYAETINELASRLAAGNLEVRSSTLAQEAEIKELRGENVLPDPTVELEQLWGSKESGNKLTATVSQEFMFPTVYSNRAKAADYSTQSLEYIRQSTYLEKALEAKQYIIEYIYVKKCIETLSDISRNLNYIETKSRMAKDGGEMTILDINKLNIERIALDQRILEYENRLIAIIGNLSAISGGEDCKALLSGIKAYPTEKLLSAEEYAEIALAKDPKLASKDYEIKAQDALMSTEKASRLPHFSLGYIYNREAGETFNGFNVALSLPLWSGKNRREAISLTQKNIEMESQLLSIENNTEIAVDVQTATNLSKRIEAYNAAIGDSDNSALLRRALDSGTITVLQYLQESNYFTEATLNLLQLEYEYQSTLANLNRYELLQ